MFWGRVQRNTRNIGHILNNSLFSPTGCVEMNTLKRMFLCRSSALQLTRDANIFELRSTTQQFIVKARILIRDYLFGDVKSAKNRSFPGNIAGRSTGRRLSINNQLVGSVNDSLNPSIVSKLVSRWVSNSIAADLRRNAAKQLLRGSGLSLGLVGVCINKKGPTLLTDVDEVEAQCQQIQSVFSTILANYLAKTQKTTDSRVFNLKNLQLGEAIAKGCNAVVYEGKLKDDKKYNYAVKMMFNYDVESNSAAIWSSMNKECLTFNGNFSSNEELESMLKNRKKIKQHPNIVEINGVFVDMIPSLPKATNLYPSALPPRLYEQGFGRNMTLFLVMKRYDISLKDFLNGQLTTQTSLLLLYQLFEGISHLVKNKVAHRDIKSDNILLDISNGNEYPWLVITDFGVCSTSIRVPFTSHDVSRGGNLALMAPEVVTAEPGPFTYIDYSSSDLWSAATITYEIFNGVNPFYAPDMKCLRSSRYNENDLPELPTSTPKPICSLIRDILRRNPSERPSAKVATTLCAMLLFCSKRTLASMQALCNTSETVKSQRLLQWLRTISATTFCQRNTIIGGKRLNAVELKARLLFLADVKVENLLPAFAYLHDV